VTETLVPLWLKLGYAAFIVVIVPVYWRAYGPSNFLWLSDIGLGCTALAVIFESPLLASMPAVGVLWIEIGWCLDVISGGRLIGLAGYMFDPKYSLFLRSLSLFHVALPPTLIWMLWRYGYDPLALPLQLAVTWGAFWACYLFTDREKNINWVFGVGEKPQTRISPRLHFALLLVVFSAVIVATHFLLVWLFPATA
jgi:hypothetical protein